MKKLVIGLLVVGLMIGPAFAHPGGTDSKGGHTNRSTGEYHYHHGYPEHDHVDGVCPYDYDDRTGERSGSSGSGSSYTYTAKAETYDWYDDYREAQEARRAAEKELEEIKSNQLRNLALSAVVGLCGGLSTLIVQIRRSHKRLEERERWLLQRAEDAVKSAKREVETEWFSRLKAVEASKEESERMLIDERRRLETDRLKYEENRRQNSVMFFEMAKRAVDEDQKNTYLSKVVLNALPPTPEGGLVYVPHDLNTGLYHREYLPCGVKRMVLASKKNVAAFGLKQCPECMHAAQPTGDLIVYASPTNTQVYHVENAICASYTAKAIPLSEAHKRRLRPCSKCMPPAENPKVWF